jgi:hypothetical protein
MIAPIAALQAGTLNGFGAFSRRARPYPLLAIVHPPSAGGAL